MVASDDPKPQGDQRMRLDDYISKHATPSKILKLDKVEATLEFDDAKKSNGSKVPTNLNPMVDSEETGALTPLLSADEAIGNSILG